MMEGNAGYGESAQVGIGRLGRFEQTAQGYGGPTLPPPPTTMPTLAGLVNQINQKLNMIQERQSIIDGALGRLVGPRPCNPTDNSKVASEPAHLDAHLHLILRRLDEVMQAEVATADTLNAII